MKVHQFISSSAKKLFVFMSAAVVGCSSPELNPIEAPSQAKGARTEDKKAQEVWEKIKKHPNYFEVRNRKGILEFSTPQVFEEYMKKMTNQPYETLEKWEKTLNFVSMRTILEKAKAEELKHIKEKKLQKPDLSHSAYFKHYEHLLNYEKGNISLKMPLLAFTPFLNEDGLVRIAGHLFQYSENNFKVIVGGDEKKIGSLKTLHTSNKEQGILVFPIRQVSLKPNGRVENYSRGDYKCTDLSNSIFVSADYCSSLSAFEYPYIEYDYSVAPTFVCGIQPNGVDECLWVYPILSSRTYTMVTTSMNVSYSVLSFPGTPPPMTNMSITGYVDGRYVSYTDVSSAMLYNGIWTFSGATQITHQATIFYTHTNYLSL